MQAGLKQQDTSLPAVSTDWQLKDIGDLSNDGNADVLWRDTSGKLILWEMSNGTKIKEDPLDQVSTDWHLQAIGDFNKDGKADLLWRNDSGRTELWTLDGTIANNAL